MSVEAPRQQEYFLNAQSLVPRAINGDSTASEAIDEHLRPQFNRFFLSRLPDNAEDLTQIALAGVFNGLAQFDPARGKYDYNHNFRNWCFAIARYTLARAYRQNARRRTTSLSGLEVAPRQEPHVPEHELDALMPQLRDRLVEILTPGQYRVVLLRLEGKTMEQILAVLSINRNTYIGRMTEARTRYEERLIKPAGFKAIGSKTLSEAARRHALEAAYFLGRYYTTDEWITRYRPRMRFSSHSGFPKGILPEFVVQEVVDINRVTNPPSDFARDLVEL